MGLRNLTKEMDDLSHWLMDYAYSLPDEENVKISDAARYIRILKTLVEISPDEIVDKIQL